MFTQMILTVKFDSGSLVIVKSANNTSFHRLSVGHIYSVFVIFLQCMIMMHVSVSLISTGEDLSR